jgi:hypothetical protein
VRRIIQEGGYELQGGSTAPLLKLDHVSSVSDLLLSDSRLSIDHLTPQSDDFDLSLSSSNIRFMSQRDNSSRGANFGRDDKVSQSVLEYLGLPTIKPAAQ